MAWRFVMVLAVHMLKLLVVIAACCMQFPRPIGCDLIVSLRHYVLPHRFYPVVTSYSVGARSKSSSTLVSHFTSVVSVCSSSLHPATMTPLHTRRVVFALACCLGLCVSAVSAVNVHARDQAARRQSLRERHASAATLEADLSSPDSVDALVKLADSVLKNGGDVDQAARNQDDAAAAAAYPAPQLDSVNAVPEPQVIDLATAEQHHPEAAVAEPDHIEFNNDMDSDVRYLTVLHACVLAFSVVAACWNVIDL